MGRGAVTEEGSNGGGQGAVEKENTRATICPLAPVSVINLDLTPAGRG